MTLCVAWKYEEENQPPAIYFAADTCAVMGGELMPYGGIKILQVPVVYATPPPEGGNSRVAWSTTYGLGFAGSFFAAFLVKELIASVLSCIQGIMQPANLTFDTICNLVAKFHRHFHHEIHRHLRYSAEIDFFFAGLCPSSNQVRIAKFFVDPAGATKWIEILQGGGVKYDMIGMPDACDRFKELMELNLSAPPCRVHYAAFHRLRDIILDPKIRWVDGAIQAGYFNREREFQLSGAAMIEMGNLGPTIKQFIRGTNIEEVHQAMGPLDLHVAAPVADLFGQEIRAFRSDGFYAPPNHVRVKRDELITVIPYDPAWPTDFEGEAVFLRMSFPGAKGIEHIGSTAVPGTVGVPVIDVMVGLDAIWAEREPSVDLSGRGYEYVGGNGIADRRFFRRRGEQSFNVHVVQVDGPFWNLGIALRCHLRIQPDLAKDYSQEKLRILNSGAWTLMRYDDLKRVKMAELAGALGMGLS
jgi:GrpB-like predicted nucleotidyltransferase (UPF0157 family)